MIDEPLKILLVEGHSDESALITRLLEGPPEPGDLPGRFTVSETPRLAGAAHLLEREPFDAVLLDLNLPRSIGLEPFERLREQKPGLPVILLTGLRDRPLAEEALKRGASDFLVKGALSAALLRRCVRYAVERGRLLQEIARVRAAPPSQGPEAEGKDAFMRKVSHELRNTVTTVKAAVYCLSDGLPDPLTAKQRQLIAMIARNVERQAKTIDDVMDLSRLRSGRRKAAREPVEPGLLAEELAREARMRGASRPVELEIHPRVPAVHADPELLSQALRQLLDNAFRHAAARVTLRVEPDGDGVLFTVADDGAGIPPERLDGLFTDGLKAWSAPPGKGRGCGLGLAICREIAAIHGGRIWAENGFPGACLRLRVPGVPRPAAAPRRRPPAPLPETSPAVQA